MARKRKGQPINGWVVIDKPIGPTSTDIGNRVRRTLDAMKAGHGGTLDPLATGVLPIALGEATKTVNYALHGDKAYVFTLRFGEARSTDDAEGEVIATSDVRPSDEAITQILEQRFTGVIRQRPPRFSAIKVDGERAYDLARAGEEIVLDEREVEIDMIRLAERPDADHAVIEVECGPGTYMRSLARDIALALGSVGHVATLRRTRAGPFTESHAIPFDTFVERAQGGEIAGLVLPIETALDDIPVLALTDDEAGRLRNGQSILLVKRSDMERLKHIDPDLPPDEAAALAMCQGRPVALVRLDGAEIKPLRVLNL